MIDLVMDCDNCDMLCNPNHVTSQIFNHLKRKVKEKRNKVIIVKIAYNNEQSNSHSRYLEVKLLLELGCQVI